MKSLKDLKNLLEQEKDFSKFDALVRAGLGNKAQIRKLHDILNKMSEEKPNFSSAERAIIQNIFNKMIDLLSNNPNIFQQSKKALRESVIDTSDYKLSPTGKKVKSHKIFFKDDPLVKEEFVRDPPVVLVLKRDSIRLYPNNTKVAIYKNDKLNKQFAIQFTQTDSGMLQAEEYDTELQESVMDTLHKIVDGKAAQKVKFATGETRKVDHFTASAIVQVHKALNDDNKKKFADMVHKSPAHFSKASDFAFSKRK